MKSNTALLFSDLHASSKKLNQLKQTIIKENPDLLLFTGDIVNMGEPVWFAEKFIEVIQELKIPFLWVPGNNDFGRSYHKVQAKYKSLEGRVVEIDLNDEVSRLKDPMARDEERKNVLRFTGVGGSPASWSGQYEGEQSIDKKAIAGSIFLSHVPPPGIITLSKFDDPKQTTAKRFSDAPLVHICAHVHWQWGVSHLGQTKVIKLASFETGHYAMMNLENLKVEFKEIK